MKAPLVLQPKRLGEWMLLHRPDLWATRLHEYVFWSGIVGMPVAFLLGALVPPVAAFSGMGNLLTVMFAGLFGHLCYLLAKLWRDRPAARSWKEHRRALLARFAVLLLPSLDVLAFLAGHGVAHPYLSLSAALQTILWWGGCTAFFLPGMAGITIIAHYWGKGVNGFVAGMSFGFACLGLMALWATSALFFGLAFSLGDGLRNSMPPESFQIIRAAYATFAGIAALAVQFAVLLGFQRTLADELHRPRLDS